MEVWETILGIDKPLSVLLVKENLASFSVQLAT